MNRLRTWWACSTAKDMVDRQSNGLVLQSSSWYRHGFSVRDRQAALGAMAKALKAKGLEVPNAPALR